MDVIIVRNRCRHSQIQPRSKAEARDELANGLGLVAGGLEGGGELELGS
jgi:hypothetical protein